MTQFGPDGRLKKPLLRLGHQHNHRFFILGEKISGFVQ